MVALKRLGQAHNIDDILTHRRARNLIVHCPVCPEPHFNIGSRWREIPELLRYAPFFLISSFHLTDDYSDTYANSNSQLMATTKQIGISRIRTR